MQKHHYLIATLAALVLLSGCASTVRTRTSTFMAPDTDFGQGTIAVQAADASLQNSLEFELYRSKLEGRLRAEGYTIAPPETAEYVARLGYKVSETEQERRRPNTRLTTGFGPYWMTGFGPYYPPLYRYRPDLYGHDPFYDAYPYRYRSRFGYRSYWGFGPYYSRHGWGRMVEPVEYRPAYVRTLNLSIARTPAGPAEKPRRVYEVKAASAGSCPTMSVVFDEMLAAIFHDFPGENGAVKTLRVEGETRCS